MRYKSTENHVFLKHGISLIFGAIVACFVYFLLYVPFSSTFSTQRELSVIGYETYDASSIIDVLKVASAKAMTRGADVKFAYTIQDVCKLGKLLNSGSWPGQLVLQVNGERAGEPAFVLAAGDAFESSAVCTEDVPNHTGLMLTKSAELRKALAEVGKVPLFIALGGR